jgi:hypothetical protein
MVGRLPLRPGIKAGAADEHERRQRQQRADNVNNVRIM